MTAKELLDFMQRNPDVVIHVWPMHGIERGGELKAEVAPGVRAVLFVDEDLIPTPKGVAVSDVLDR